MCLANICETNIRLWTLHANTSHQQHSVTMCCFKEIELNCNVNRTRQENRIWQPNNTAMMQSHPRHARYAVAYINHTDNKWTSWMISVEHSEERPCLIHKTRAKLICISFFFRKFLHLILFVKPFQCKLAFK